MVDSLIKNIQYYMFVQYMARARGKDTHMFTDQLKKFLSPGGAGVYITRFRGYHWCEIVCERNCN